MTTPKVNSASQKQLDKMQGEFDTFQENIESMTKDRLDAAPKIETEQQTKISNREAQKYDAPYIKPLRSINSKEPFNEKYRKDWERGWEYVKCIFENNEIIGEQIELWTKRFAGDPAHQWKLPVNKPVWVPRLVAEQVQKCRYHRLRMEDQPTSQGEGMTFYGSVSVDREIARLDARPVGSGFITAGF